jgi:hypothetical protein
VQQQRRQLTKANTKAEAPFQNQQRQQQQQQPPLFVCDFMCVRRRACVRRALGSLQKEVHSPFASFTSAVRLTFIVARAYFCHRAKIKLMRGAQLRRVVADESK